MHINYKKILIDLSYAFCKSLIIIDCGYERSFIFSKSYIGKSITLCLDIALKITYDFNSQNHLQSTQWYCHSNKSLREMKKRGSSIGSKSDYSRYHNPLSRTACPGYWLPRQNSGFYTQYRTNWRKGFSWYLS